MTVWALTADSVDLTVGAVWVIAVSVRDLDGCLADDAPVVTITLPVGGPVTPTVETVTTGVYRVPYVPAVAGRFVAHVATADNGDADFVCVATAVTANASMPVLADLRSGDPAEPGYLEDSSATDSELEGALEVEAAAQRRVCRVPAAYPPDLREALLRRVARNLAMRAEPRVALPGDLPVITPSRDPEVRRLEAPWRKLVMG